MIMAEAFRLIGVILSLSLDAHIPHITRPK
jgi:hypothetical protein